MTNEDSVRELKDFNKKTDLTLKMLLREEKNVVVLQTVCV